MKEFVLYSVCLNMSKQVCKKKKMSRNMCTYIDKNYYDLYIKREGEFGVDIKMSKLP